MAYNIRQSLILNINAIKLAFQLHNEHRQPTESEKLLLREYTGFGGIRVILQDTNKLNNWSKYDLTLLPAVENLWDTLRANSQNEHEFNDYRSSLRNSVLTSFYTPNDFIRELGQNLYRLLGKLPDSMLEPSAGNGRFLHLFDGIEGSENITRTAFEKDKLTGLILKALETDTKVYIDGFENIPHDKLGTYDLAISNIPFGDFRVFDPLFANSKDIQRKDATNKIHNYFFVKGLDTVRNGGLVVYITSRAVAETDANRPIREYLCQHANLISGIRLNDNMFSDSGLSKIGTDLLIFQRNDNKQELSEEEKLFIETQDYTMTKSYDEEVVDIVVTQARNQYFNEAWQIDETERLHSLGTPMADTDRFGKPTVVYSEDENVLDTWQKLLSSHLTRDFKNNYNPELGKIEDVALEEPTQEQSENEIMSLWDLFGLSEAERTQIKTTGKRRTKTTPTKTVKPATIEHGRRPLYLKGEVYSNHYAKDTILHYEGQIGRYGYNKGGKPEFVPIENLSEEEANILHLYVDIRDTLWSLKDTELDTQVEQSHIRTQLNSYYDTLVDHYGALRGSRVSSIAMMDPHYNEVAIIERYENEQRVKADIFFEPVNIIKKNIQEEMSVEDALSSCLNLQGTVSLDYIAEHTGLTENEIKQQLYERIYYNPISKNWEEQGMMLSGDVYEKIEHYTRELDFIDKNYMLSKNERRELKEEVNHTIQALEQAKPEIIPFEELDFNLGERWIPTDYYTDYIKTMMDCDSKVEYSPANDMFHIEISYAYIADKKWGINTNHTTISAADIFSNAMLNVFPEYKYKEYDYTKNGQWEKVEFVDKEATQLAAMKIRELQDYFPQWLSQLPVERRDALTNLYNKRFNCFVRPSYNGSFQTFPGLRLDNFDYKDLYPSQKDAIWMIKQNGGGICDHQVGAGKTMIMCVAAHEMKRVGISQKPMIIALKANVHEIAATYKRAYPDAKILYPGKDDFTPAKRETLFHDIANNNYDCIILTHDQFIKIPQSPEVQQRILSDELWDVEKSLDVAEQFGYGSVNRRTIAGLEQRKENLLVKIKKLQSRINERKDNDVDFRSMGIDHIFVDESHQFKNLMFQTRHNRVAGLGNTHGSQRSMNLLFAIRDIQARTGRDLGATFLSGTTISNSLTELYVLFKYLRPKALKRQNITCFDAWAAVFTRKSSEFEFNVTNDIIQKERLRFFVKVPELAQFYNQITDYRTADMIGIDRPEKNARFINIEPNDYQQAFLQKLMEFAKNGDGNLLGRDELSDSEKKAKMLIATNYSNKVALDMRLIDPHLYEQMEGGKVDTCAKMLNEYYHRFNEVKGTQFVFSDTGTYKPGEWNLYSAIKQKLVDEYGIPEKEIRFIQECSTENSRKKVIDAMNKGEVRILFGSTSMLGTGVNAQERAVALHHIDTPWRPSDLEQREGRAIRKGNIIAKQYNDNRVDVITYATERTLDAYKFNLLQNKQLFINQLKSRQLGSRTLDEGAMDEQSGVNFAEYVAILSGNTDLLDKARIDKQIKQLESEQTAFKRETARLERNILAFQKKIKHNDQLALDMRHDFKTFEKYQNKGFVTPAGATLMGKELGRYIATYRRQLKSKPNSDMEVTIGRYCNFDVMLIMKKGTDSYDVNLKSRNNGQLYNDGWFPTAYDLVEAWLGDNLRRLNAKADDLAVDNARLADNISGIQELLTNRSWNKQEQLDELKQQSAILEARILESINQDKQQAEDEIQDEQNEQNDQTEQEIHDNEQTTTIDEQAVSNNAVPEIQQPDIISPAVTDSNQQNSSLSPTITENSQLSTVNDQQNETESKDSLTASRLRTPLTDGHSPSLHPHEEKETMATPIVSTGRVGEVSVDNNLDVSISSSTNEEYTEKASQEPTGHNVGKVEDAVISPAVTNYTLGASTEGETNVIAAENNITTPTTPVQSQQIETETPSLSPAVTINNTESIQQQNYDSSTAKSQIRNLKSEIKVSDYIKQEENFSPSALADFLNQYTGETFELDQHGSFKSGRIEGADIISFLGVTNRVRLGYTKTFSDGTEQYRATFITPRDLDTFKIYATMRPREQQESQPATSRIASPETATSNTDKADKDLSNPLPENHISAPVNNKDTDMSESVT